MHSVPAHKQVTPGATPGQVAVADLKPIATAPAAPRERAYSSNEVDAVRRKLRTVDYEDLTTEEQAILGSQE